MPQRMFSSEEILTEYKQGSSALLLLLSPESFYSGQAILVLQTKCIYHLIEQIRWHEEAIKHVLKQANIEPLPQQRVPEWKEIDNA